MTETPKTPGDTPAPKAPPEQRTPEQTARSARLARALRDNLRRRKIARPAAAKAGGQNH
jgi:hypothetical protein